jgi:hypothetical protein
MKNISITFFLVFFMTACQKDTDEPQQANYTIEGRWLWVPNNGATANTMYEFKDGIRYTYYCSLNECNPTYWNSLPISAAIPGPHKYTFKNDTLKVDLNFGNKLVTAVTFDCKGGRVNFVTLGYSLYKVGVNQNCN